MSALLDGRPVRCPVGTTRPDGSGHTIIGCGSTDVVWDGDDEVYDCRRCGMWFDQTEARLEQTRLCRQGVRS